MTPRAASWPGWGCVFDGSVLFSFLVVLTTSWRNPFSGDFGLTGVYCIACISANAAVRAPPDSSTWKLWPGLGFLGQILNWGPLQFLARYSYAIYIMQWPSIVLCHWCLPKLLFEHFAAVPLAILLGILADEVIDKPMQWVLAKWK